VDTIPGAQAHLPRFDLDIALVPETHRLMVGGTVMPWAGRGSRNRTSAEHGGHSAA